MEIIERMVPVPYSLFVELQYDSLRLEMLRRQGVEEWEGWAEAEKALTRALEETGGIPEDDEVQELDQ